MHSVLSLKSGVTELDLVSPSPDLCSLRLDLLMASQDIVGGVVCAAGGWPPLVRGVALDRARSGSPPPGSGTSALAAGAPTPPPFVPP
jgi:hypothetical protein